MKEKKQKKTIICFISILIFCVVIISQANGYYMILEQQSYSDCIYGNNLYVGGDGPGNYSTIKDAVNNSNDGDFIYIYSKVYHEHNIIVDKSITMTGEDKNTTIIDGDDLDYDVLILSSDNITVEGFTIQKSGFDEDGISIRSSDNKVFDCKIYDNADNGIIIADGCNNNTVSFCYFYNNTWGLQIHGWDEIDYNNVISHCIFGPGDDLELWKAKNTVVTNCIFNESKISERATDATSILNCDFYGWFTGISLIYSGNDVRIENCTFIGQELSGLETSLGNQYNLTVRNCTFENCGYNGIRFGYLENSIISDCKFINNTYAGVRFWSGMTRTQVSRCHFEGNKNGIEMAWRNWLNKFTENNFINNHQKNIHKDNPFVMLNFYSRNYWDDWIGIGPYHVIGLFNWDWHPAQEPYDI